MTPIRKQDSRRRLKENAIATVLINDGDGPTGNGDPYRIDVCSDVGVSPGSEKYGMSFTNPGVTRFCYASVMQGGQCSITGVNAPPGVQVRAYAGGDDYEWTVDSLYRCPVQSTFDNLNMHRSCTWMPYSQKQTSYNTVDGWWPMSRPPPYSSDSFWDGTVYDFYGDLPLMNCDTSSVTGLDTTTGVGCTEWTSNGCGAFRGVCYLEFRLEQTASTSAMCWDASELGVPNCPNIPSVSRPIRPFVVTTDPFASLWRCDACTPLVQPLVSGAPLSCVYEGFESAYSLTTNALAEVCSSLPKSPTIACPLRHLLRHLWRHILRPLSESRRCPSSRDRPPSPRCWALRRRWCPPASSRRAVVWTSW